MSGTIANQTIANQTWQMIEEVNESLSQTETAQKQGQAQIAQGNRSVGQAVVIKDVILPAAPDGKQTAATAAKNPGSPGKAQLPYPGYNSKVFGGTGEQEQGLIAIMGAVLALQAKTNSNFWSTLWQQASQSMEMQVEFAPIVGAAIQSQYNAQSAATSAQATQSETDAFISFGMFGTSMLMAGYMEYSEPGENTTPTDESPANENETDEPGGTNPESPESLSGEAEQVDSNADKVITDEDESFRSRASKTFNWAKGKLQAGQKTVTSFLGKGLQTTQMFSMLSQASTGMNDAKYQSRQAAQQGLEGQAAATSQEAQMYSQFYGQDFSRMEDLRQGSGQNLDYAMNILLQASNSITQTDTSMFRG